MPASLAPVERPGDLDAVPDGALALPLSAAALLKAQLEGRPHVDPWEAVPEAVLEDLGEANFGRVEAICRRLDDLYSGVAAGTPLERARPAHWDAFWLNIVVDAISARAVQIARAAEHVGAATLIHFSDGRPPDAGVPIADSVSLAAEVVPAVASER